MEPLEEWIMAQHNRATRSIDRHDSQPTVRPLPGPGAQASPVPPLDADNLDRVFDRLAELLASGAPSSRRMDSAPAGKVPSAAPISPHLPKAQAKPQRPATHNKILEPQARPEDIHPPAGDVPAQPSNDVHLRTTLRAPRMQQEPRPWPTAKVIRLLQPPQPEIDPASALIEPLPPIEVKIVDTESANVDADRTATLLPPSRPGRIAAGEPSAERRSRPSAWRLGEQRQSKVAAPSRSFSRLLAGSALLVIAVGAIASWVSSPVETAPSEKASAPIPQETAAVVALAPAPSAEAIEAPPVSTVAVAAPQIEEQSPPASDRPAADRPASNSEAKPLKSDASPPLSGQRPPARARKPSAAAEKPPAPPVTPPAPTATAAPPKGRILD
ncbi:MAG: hypothetical protein U0359_32490 [Byssovorax sp.]